MEMQGQDSSTRPSIGFPLGLALLFILLVCMSGFFTCCLHWDRLRSLLGISTNDQENHVRAADDVSLHKSTPPPIKKGKNEGQSLPVLMPGDDVPKFIAISCPCEPPVLARPQNRVKVQKPPTFPVPLY